MNNTYTDVTITEPRWIVGYYASSFQIVDTLTQWYPGHNREIIDDLGAAYLQADELNRQYYGDERFTGWRPS